ncbi:uncharacterized protein LOC143879291 isoform X2 [Tasmannia lanceolata]|uniref:uncharacterized protein LOC143879291 isoform X2 n=1 Tax=Tasmannia lanceolata TaxID=3420 RepID=UPI0040628B77
MKMICRHSPQMNGLEGSLSQGMSFLKLHPSYPQISSLPVSTLPHHHAFSSTFPPSIPPRKPCLRNPRISDSETPVSDKYPETLVSTGFEDLATDGAVYQNTLRLVECSMFAAVAGLAYFLSNSLAIENYFGCFFSLPIVISSMRWGVSAGRKTMVATAMLLLTLSGPVKASTYLLMHGLVGLAMGSLWRLGANWGLSIVLCTFVRAMGATGFVLITSFLIRENILALITINIHASVSYILAAIGINTIPSMNAIYTIFGSLVMLNSGFFVFLLHILYAVFLTKLGMKASLTLPRWLEKAI